MKRRERSSNASTTDVARHAGVSQATVSFVMTDRPGIAAETRERVLRSAKELGYRPNRLASGLLRGKSRAIGVVLPGQSTDFGWAIFRGVQHELTLQGYVPILLDSRPPNGEGLDELELMRRLIDYRVEGIVLYGVSESACYRYLSELRERGVPVVTVDHEFADTPCDHVGTDNVALGRQVAHYLLGRGYRALGHLASLDAMSPTRDRRRGFVEAAAERGATVCVETQARPDYGEAEAEKLAEAMPDGGAVFASNDVLARSLYRALRRRGRTTGDVAVMGVGNYEWTEWLEPGLTTVDQSPMEIGREAIRLVLDRIRNGNDTPPRLKHIPFALVERGSTPRAAPAESPRLEGG